MKKLAILYSLLLLASCKKTTSSEVITTGQVNNNSNSSKGTVAAKIDDRQWKSAAKSTADTNVYLAAINNGTLQIKTFGSFTDSMGASTQDQLGIYIEGVTDTGTYSLSLSNYIAYNQLLATPQYFSSQISNIGKVHITNLTDSTISGTFECRVDNTAGSGSIIIKEGSFSNVLFQ